MCITVNWGRTYVGACPQLLGVHSATRSATALQDHHLEAQPAQLPRRGEACRQHTPLYQPCLKFWILCFQKHLQRIGSTSCS